MDIRKTLSIINSLEKEYYRPPRSYHKKKIQFEMESYGHSAINEIKYQLLIHQNEDPISVLEQFRHQMDCFACKTKNGDTNFMFSVYYDVATDVIDCLLERGG